MRYIHLWEEEAAGPESLCVDFCCGEQSIRADYLCLVTVCGSEVEASMLLMAKSGHWMFGVDVDMIVWWIEKGEARLAAFGYSVLIVRGGH